jgi:ADP-ribose pyrophosphatase YjhB (NUDIX family)
VRQAWFVEDGYATPKVDVRGAIFRDDRVSAGARAHRRQVDAAGGWADINDTPSSAVLKEIEQESASRARVTKLAAVYDRNKHNHPSTCSIPGRCSSCARSPAARRAPATRRPPSSSSRRTSCRSCPRALERRADPRMHEHHRNPDWPTEFD